MKERNKELIELIKEELKNAEELPYKEGAWEAYKSRYEPVQKGKYRTLSWVAAAAIALAGFTFLFLNPVNSPDTVTVVESQQQRLPLNQPTAPPTVESEDEALRTAANADLRVSMNESNQKGPLYVTAIPDRGALERVHLPAVNEAPWRSQTFGVAAIPAPERLSVSVREKPLATFSWDDDLMPGEQINPNFAYQSEAARQVSPKKVRLTDRLELGAFVSPSTTDRSFDLGGGLVFAYRFNDKLALRSGASFNQYEVAMLQSQVREIGEEMKQASAPIKNTDKLISKEASSLRTNSFFMPNLNAVTGKVQTLDIPLEIRYNLTKEFYTTGGVSYAAVLFQERFDHYEESAGIPTYSSASDSPEPVENPVTTISTTQASAYENIDNGFGGFVNFSIGRRVNMGKTIKVSIEPFVKLPVGQFKRADMNYTNGGIRIMTSF